jgi:hypothetical protein
MATAWTVHGMRDEGSCVVRCVRGVRGVCVCVQASPAACSTYRAGQLAASQLYDTGNGQHAASNREKLRPTTHSYLPAFRRRTCVPTAPLTRHVVFASIANSATRVHVNLELSALCSLHSPKVPDQHQKP